MHDLQYAGECGFVCPTAWRETEVRCYIAQPGLIKNETNCNTNIIVVHQRLPKCTRSVRRPVVLRTQLGMVAVHPAFYPRPHTSFKALLHASQLTGLLLDRGLAVLQDAATNQGCVLQGVGWRLSVFDSRT